VLQCRRRRLDTPDSRGGALWQGAARMHCPALGVDLLPEQISAEVRDGGERKREGERDRERERERERERRDSERGIRDRERAGSRGRPHRDGEQPR
jgi:hypothetical protein